ncbi:hypothetical protein QBC32DRAFT_313684 [Pseudoneurospora amorphoporcata]|uniref:Uncharacterized protein n=1 Tax=Pseudoneurospora amorphoporcata TaxID=241081 RepID=A0AAN6NX85_9PEZI|nr:hypothetical protein QBC32DRAFT_313684 [Pseudoneurospora amorphoporcata]
MATDCKAPRAYSRSSWSRHKFSPSSAKTTLGAVTPPASDPRITAWKAEKRTFKGKIVQSSALEATRTALAAQKADLWVKGNPQFAIFCDGSCRNTQVSQFHGTKGGYGVVFRDPYEPDNRDIDLAFDKNQLRHFEESERDGLNEDDFTIRQWLSGMTFTPHHAELCAIAQSNEEAIKRVIKHGPVSATVRIFTDSRDSQRLIEKTIQAVNNAQNPRKRKRTEGLPFHDRHIVPVVRAIVWQSHFLFEHGCKLEIHWMPRCSTFAARIADHVAGLWRREDAIYSQENLASGRRDGMMDKFHEEVSDIVRSRLTPPPTANLNPASRPERPMKKRRLNKRHQQEARNQQTATTAEPRYFGTPNLDPIMAGPPSRLRWIWIRFPHIPSASTRQAPHPEDQRPLAEPEASTLNEFPSWFIEEEDEFEVARDGSVRTSNGSGYMSTGNRGDAVEEKKEREGKKHKKEKAKKKDNREEERRTKEEKNEGNAEKREQEDGKEGENEIEKVEGVEDSTPPQTDSNTCVSGGEEEKKKKST